VNTVSHSAACVPAAQEDSLTGTTLRTIHFQRPIWPLLPHPALDRCFSIPSKRLFFINLRVDFGFTRS
jgi:hypothetical protein